jgi:microcystin-dependent protein
VSKIRVFPFNVAPAGWLQCQGQTLQINQYAALYSLIGIQFGGNGTTTFMLPDLRRRVGVSQGAGSTRPQYLAGKAGGQESVAVTLGEMPAHAYTFSGTSAGATTNNPTGPLLAARHTDPDLTRPWRLRPSTPRAAPPSTRIANLISR